MQGMGNDVIRKSRVNNGMRLMEATSDLFGSAKGRGVSMSDFMATDGDSLEVPKKPPAYVSREVHKGLELLDRVARKEPPKTPLETPNVHVVILFQIAGVKRYL